MNRITKRTPRFGSSKGKPNPFENRGMDKFQEVYSELERMRETIAAQEGVSTSDVWFTRGTSKGRDWIPVVVGRSRSSAVSSRLNKQTSIPHWENEKEVKEAEEEAHQTTSEAKENRIRCTSDDSTTWISVRSDQFIHELQQGARKALKAITLFIMIVAAIADVLIAVVAEFTSSFVAKHLRPLWAHCLPLQLNQQDNKDLSFAFPLALCSLSSSPASPKYSCVSAPTSPRHHHNFQAQQQQQQQQQQIGVCKQITSFSTPVSPVRSNCTYFSCDRPLENVKLCGSPTKQQTPQQQAIFSSVENAKFSKSPRKQQHQERLGEGLKVSFGSPKKQQQRQQQDHSASDATPVMLMLVIILLGLSVGRVTALILASMAWFSFPVGRKLTAQANSNGFVRRKKSTSI